MEVVEAIAEIGESPSEEGQHVAVSEGAQELQEELAHALVEPVGLAAQHAERLLGEPAEELLRVDLKTELNFRDFNYSQNMPPCK